ncbi:aldo/keto reductase [Mucilaginibacter rubeus]|uniref:Aldo/keto reductase n=1 Tax=Mucilaginibacter rubeus TaxID=2027860 RepID=A0AAE6JHH1_9SPHI|nr:MULTISPECIES: aldo/keto reductase [Mucilaginibacter]QEM05681.1 aldo/keto reductase [Mucilaginibacter rubeus]QEM18269.1 aldo/keto reductase [Mucilaginibacter gossypii]QTE45198.1 aldo/keto reductase [Mucilaginibacter rubeus]QTE51794.1 aldo/keto reductase [Mucilaginibacter rubeus]QTE56881.1 aldo/keto reductase [Mucilaginibacter rubeus]
MNYKLLGRSGLKVSELCLGTMGFGTEGGWGAEKDTSFAIMDAFANAGGNFIDTANVYKLGTSEKIIGEYLGNHDRDYFVLATKYTLKDNTTNPNASGNNRKNMMRSVEESLKRLKTDFIDVLYLHIWDNITPIDEVLRGLDDLIKQGKVNYAAISDTPAWVVSKGNTLAGLMGWSQFIALQVEYSLLARTAERELIPMAKHYGMTVTPWAPLAGGALTGKYLRGEQGRVKPESNRRNDRAKTITEVVVGLAAELGVSESNVALQWMMDRDFSCIPIVGATKIDQLNDNLKAIDTKLAPEHFKKLNEVSAIELGFPGDFFNEDAVKMNSFGGFYDRVEKR